MDIVFHRQTEHTTIDQTLRTRRGDTGHETFVTSTVIGSFHKQVCRIICWYRAKCPRSGRSSQHGRDCGEAT